MKKRIREKWNFNFNLCCHGQVIEWDEDKLENKILCKMKKCECDREQCKKFFISKKRMNKMNKVEKWDKRFLRSIVKIRMMRLPHFYKYTQDKILGKVLGK